MDNQETINSHPESVAAWKRKAEQLQAENAALKAELEQEAQQYEDLRQDYDKSLTELDALKAELADRVSPGMVMVLKATIRELTDELAAAQKDAARLAFVESRAYVGINPHSMRCLWVLRGIYELPGQDFRAAIDKEMEAK